MQTKGVAKVLLLGRGDNTTTRESNVFSEELQSCLGILQEGSDVVLLSDRTNLTGRLKTFLDIPIYDMPLSKESVDEVVDIEMPDVVYAPFWGSAGWRLLQELAEEKYWKRNVITAVGTDCDCSFSGKRVAVAEAGVKPKRAFEVYSLKEAEQRVEELGGIPILLRTERGESIQIDKKGQLRSRLLVELGKSSLGKVVLEESILGAKEIEVGVLRDKNGFSQAVYKSENIIPGQFDTGESLGISPIQSLNAKQKKAVTDIALRVVNKLDNFIGYCTVQLLFSRDSQILVSDIKFDFPGSPAVISLAMGCSLINAVTKVSLGCPLRELTLNQENQLRQEKRVIFKVPQPRSIYNNGRLHVHSVQKRYGEQIYVGQNFCETLVKAIEDFGLGHKQNGNHKFDQNYIKNKFSKEGKIDLELLFQAFVTGMSAEEIALLTNIDTWFLLQIELIYELQHKLTQQKLEAIPKEDFSLLKTCGFSDNYVARLMSEKNKKVTEFDVRKRRDSMEISAVSILHFDRVGTKEEYRNNILILSNSTNSDSLQLPTVVLAQEARRMGFEVMLMTRDPEAVSLWMTFVDRIYIESPNRENISEIKRCEKPSAVFIDGDVRLPGYLEKYLAQIGITTVRVPFKFPNQLSDTNGTH